MMDRRRPSSVALVWSDLDILSQMDVHGIALHGSRANLIGENGPEPGEEGTFQLTK